MCWKIKKKLFLWLDECEHIEWIISQFLFLEIERVSEYIVISIFMLYFFIFSRSSSMRGGWKVNRMSCQDIKFLSWAISSPPFKICDGLDETAVANFFILWGYTKNWDKAIWIHYWNMTINYQFPRNIFQLQSWCLAYSAHLL